MRVRGCWIVLLAGVLMVGCTSSPKKPAPGGGASDPPVIPPPPKLAAGTEAGASVTKGLLAGQVIDSFNRNVPKASIQLVEVRESGTPAAPLEVLTNEQGYFTIPGLDPSQTYQLTARVAEGSKVVMAATVFARPPDPRLLIKISEDFATSSTPTPPPLPVVAPPGKVKQPEEKKEPKPAAELGRPAPKPEGSAPPEGGAETPEAAPVRVPRPDLKIEVPNPSRRTPPLLIPPRRDPPETQEFSPYSSQPLPVPSCIMLTAGQIDNFALQQVNGQAWELKRDRKGRLILLDFWHTRCPPCLAAIGHLNELEQAYQARGLEVIGVACETGPFDQRVQRVSSIRSRYDIRYRLLLAGDQDIKPCPLCTQMGVTRYPTLKLINERGEILWESQGLAERQLYDLKREIERRLPLTR